MNTGILQLPTFSQSYGTTKAQEKEADFLTLRLLNKHARVRLSPAPFPVTSFVGKVNHLAFARTKGWFAYIKRSMDGDYGVALSTLDDLRNSTLEATGEGEDQFAPKTVLSIPKHLTPTHLTFARSDEVLLVGFDDTSILLYNTEYLFVSSSTPIEPSIRLLNLDDQGPIVQILSNPGDLPNLVLILREATSAAGVSVEVLDVLQRQTVSGWKGSLPETTPTAVSWSPKGKQLALGMRSGDILTYAPSDVTSVKQTIRCPPQAANQSVSSLYWLTNNAFYAIYVPLGSNEHDATQKHVLIVHDAKSNSSMVTEFETPYFPSPALRPPGAFAAILRNWDPAKFLMFISDSTSSDIGLVGCLAHGSNEIWANFSLEETSTPSVPLDKDSEDTVPLSLELDTTFVTAAEPAICPVMFVYASDGTLQSWKIINEKGSYPGMTQLSTPKQSEATAHQLSSTAEISIDSDKNGSALSEQPKTGFGAFASPMFGTSAFGQTSTSASPFAPIAPKSGFGAFASTATKVGSPSFGFNSFSTQQPSNFGFEASSSNIPPVQAYAAADAASPEADMVDAEAESTMGGLSLGSSDSTSTGNRTNSMFGSFDAKTTTSQPVSAFSGSNIQPAKGFGAFGGGNSSFNAQNSVFSNSGANAANTNASQMKLPVTAFGSSSSPATTTFGQPSFGKPSFGQSSLGAPAFGKSTFGLTPTPTTTDAFSSSGSSKGFGAFAQGGQSAFGLAPKTNSTQSITMATSSEDEKPQLINAPQQPNGSVFDTQRSGLFGGKTSVSQPVSSTFNDNIATTLEISTNADKPSSFISLDSTPVRTATPMSSPEGSPSRETKDDRADVLTQESPSGETKNQGLSALSQTGSTMPFGTPSSSPFKSSKPSPASGAFGNIVSQTFKPAEGFGAFGTTPTKSSPFRTSGFGAFESTTPSSSPFANPKPATASAFGSPSAFGPGGRGPSATAGTTTPIFGSPSSVGNVPVFGKSSFGSSSLGSSTPTKIPPCGGGAFSAFSGSSGFSAFSGGKLASFADAAKAAKETVKVVEDPPEKTPIPGNSSERISLQVTPKEIPETSEDDLPPTPSSHGTFDDDPEVDDAISERGVVVERNEEEDEDEEQEDEDEGAIHEGEDGFLSDSFSEGSEEEESEFDANEITSVPQAVDKAANASPDSNESSQTLKKSPTKPLSAFKLKSTEVEISFSERNVFGGDIFSAKSDSGDGKAGSSFGQLSGAKSPSSAFSIGQIKAKAESSIFGGSSKPSDVSESSSRLMQSTTPPDSPEKDQNNYEKGPSIISPKPVPASNMVALGIGRPSSRPVKSSPLSGAPLTTNEPTSSTFASASILPKARPASPKVPFGQLPIAPVKSESTPPSFVGHTVMSQKTISLSPSAPSTPSQSLATPFNMTPTAPFKLSPAPSMPQRAPALSSVISGNAPFIMPSTPPIAPVPLISSSNVTPKTGPFASSSLLGGKSAVPPMQASEKPQSQMQLQTRFDSAMQEECQTVCVLLAKELENLKKLGGEANMFRERVSRLSPSRHSRTDLGDSSRWTMGDLDTFGRTVASLQSDILMIYEYQKAFKPLMSEIESNLLKAETRKEEIARFSKAKADPEFSKMLKARTLGPEHAETQNQLRKQIRNFNDRVEQLEMHLESCKKKIEEKRKGKPSLHPPSLDTVNRTYRNIDLAIEDQTERIASLISRVTKLDLNGRNSRSPNRSARGRFGLNGGDDEKDVSRPSRSSDGKRNESMQALYRAKVTPSIAASTAAALNAERSAQRLKVALALTRTSPLLNTQVAESDSSAPTLESFKRSLASSEGSTNQTAILSNNSSDFDDLEPDALQGSELRSGRQRKSSHQKSVQLGKSHVRIPSAIVAFDWGPMPTAKPMAQLSSDLRAIKR